MYVLCPLLVIQALEYNPTSHIRLVSSGLPAELSLHTGHRFHTFLSHVWCVHSASLRTTRFAYHHICVALLPPTRSSGQDQAATIKRQLQLLLPGIQAFLDVDNLDEISKLEAYIEESQTVLFFLSKGYFLSFNCQREIRATLNAKKPLVLVHEEDESKGGLPLAKIVDEKPVCC